MRKPIRTMTPKTTSSPTFRPWQIEARPQAKAGSEALTADLQRLSQPSRQLAEDTSNNTFRSERQTFGGSPGARRNDAKTKLDPNWTPDVTRANRESDQNRTICRYFLGVSDGTRTRGRLDHNQELYQLSYAHHVMRGKRV